MLHILLFVVKMAGFLILGFLGLLLFIVLSVLLVPLRYRGKGSYYKKPEGTVKVTWFLRIISIRASYGSEDGLSVEARVFGFPVLKKTVGEEKVEEDLEEAGEAAWTGMEEAGDVLTEEGYEEEPLVSAQEIKEPEQVKRSVEEAYSEPADKEGQTSREEPAGSNGEAFQDEPAGKNIFRRLRLKLCLFISRIRLTAARALKGLRRAEAFKTAVLDFLGDQENQKTIRLIKRQVKKIFRHLLPLKLRGKFVFGFSDPYLTGQVLSGAALLYPYYRDALQICPVFEENILEGELFLKGRIRIGTLLMAGLRILLNKNFRIQLKRFLNRGGMRHGR